MERLSVLGNVHAYCVWIPLLGGTARKFSRLITWPGASTFSGAITLDVACVLDPLGACAFIGTCMQHVLMGHQCGLRALWGLMGVQRLACTPVAPQVAKAETGATSAQNQHNPLPPRLPWGPCPSLHLVGRKVG